MAKAVDGLYAAGRRGAAWLKVKQARTLDLVILAAEWGSGRRRGTLSNLHLGARDPERGGFVMLGKTFKGLTDEMLAWQTKKFLELEIGRDDYTVYSPARGGGGDRVQRDSGEPAVSGRCGAALRAREALSVRQDRGRRPTPSRRSCRCASDRPSVPASDLRPR
jgi:DNA ligase-1